MLDGDPLQNLNVVGVVLLHHARVLHIGAVIDEGADFDAIRELGHAAHVIAMVMSDENVVELFDFGRLGGLHNAVRIAAVKAAPSGVDQQRVAGGSNDERGLSAFHIDKIDLQGFGGEGQSKRAGQGESKQQYENEDRTEHCPHPITAR